MEFTYSRKQDLEDLYGRLSELLEPNTEGTRSLKELDAGIYDSKQRIEATRVAIEEHERVMESERVVFDREIKAAKNYEIKQKTYPLVVEYYNCLLRAQEIAENVKGGYGFVVSDVFAISANKYRHDFAILVREAEKGVRYLEQFKA